MNRPVSLQEQVAEVERELRLRRNVYPSMISRGNLKESDARRRIEHLEAVLVTLKRLENAPATGDLFQPPT